MRILPGTPRPASVARAPSVWPDSQQIVGAALAALLAVSPAAPAAVAYTPTEAESAPAQAQLSPAQLKLK